MKIAEVSTFVNYSVGKIMNDICRFINEFTSDECRIFYGRDKNKMCQSAYYFGNKLLVYANAIISRMYDNDGFCCSFLTKKLIKCLDEYKPDIIHLHCLHGYVFNLKTLFKFIRKRRIKIIWTMHDTWAFTGHCCYFSLANCEKRKLLCRKCPQKKEYPKTYVSFAKRNFLKKKKQILQLDKKSLTIVSPSSWLDDLIKQSYLNIFNSMVIHNGINTTFFNTIHINEEEKKQKMLLGVASVWDERKGLNYFINLANKIDESWKVVIIGKLPKETKLPTRIVHIERTKNQNILRDIYQKATVFFNPTLDENYPTVNLEAQLCGCKVLTFDTGGSKETQLGNLYLCEKRIDDILKCVYIIAEKPFNKVDINFANCDTMSKKYYELFKDCIKAN